MKEEFITPEIAAKYLKRNTSNRKLRRTTAIDKYAYDMIAGNWTQCVAPIVFYEDGELADGQHRLAAIVESGCAQKFYVLHGVKREAGLNIDNGLPRSLVDSAKISGLDRSLTNEMISLARALEMGNRTSSSLSNAERMALVQKHRAVCEWVLKNGPRGTGIRNSLVMAAVGRAWLREKNADLLKRYCEVLSTGFSEGPTETAAVSMRNYLLTRGFSIVDVRLWRDTFLKAQNSISYFMKGKPLTVIKTVSEEAYPLPK